MHITQRLALVITVSMTMCAVGCSSSRRGAPAEQADGGAGGSGARDGGTGLDVADGGTGDSAVPVGDAGADASTDGAVGVDSGVLSDASVDAGVDAGVDSGSDAQVADVDFGPFPCNPLTNVGCDGAQRCAWVKDAEDSTTACVAEGTVEEGLACEVATNGIDNCESGSLCLWTSCATDTTCVGTCQRICPLDDEGCPPTDHCVFYSGILSDETDTALAGVCMMGCDPVTQQTNDDGACAEDEGCFLSARSTGVRAVCAQARSTPLVQDDPIVGTVYDNGCAPGFTNIPNAAGDPVCTAHCTPVETYSGSTANIAGEAPHTCTARGASVDHECRFVWYFREHDAPHPLLNRVGVCVDPTNRLYDSNDNGTPETPWPSCADLPNTDTDGDGIPQHAEWGCAPRAP